MINQDIKDGATSTKAILIMKLFATTKKSKRFSQIWRNQCFTPVKLANGDKTETKLCILRQAASLWKQTWLREP